LLRGALVCVPLANELLSRCQELELQVKAGVAGSPDVQTIGLPDEVRKLWDRYCSDQDQTTRYPAGHPSPPRGIEDAWTFASLGAFLREPTSPLGRRCTDSEQLLSRLRNTLAHGHYVSWLHVKMMKQTLEALSVYC
jgi:hypothetical protein